MTDFGAVVVFFILATSDGQDSWGCTLPELHSHTGFTALWIKKKLEYGHWWDTQWKILILGEKTLTILEIKIAKIVSKNISRSKL